jgi:hypothetical protein
MKQTLDQLQAFASFGADRVRPMSKFYRYAQVQGLKLTLSVKSLPISFTMKQTTDEQGHPKADIGAKTPFDYNIFIGVVEQVWDDGWLVFVGESKTEPSQIFLLNSADVIAVSFTPDDSEIVIG